MSPSLYIVEVDDQCNPQLTGHTGCSYTSPPHPEVQALALAARAAELHPGPARADRRPVVGADRRRPADHPSTRRAGRRPAHHLTFVATAYLLLKVLQSMVSFCTAL